MGLINLTMKSLQHYLPLQQHIHLKRLSIQNTSAKISTDQQHGFKDQNMHLK